MSTATKDYMIKDMALADLGRKEIEIAEKEMPGLMAVREKYAKEKPLKGVKITGIHLDMGDQTQAKLTGPDIKGRFKLTLYTAARKTSYDRGYVWVMLTGAHVSKVAIEAFILVGEGRKGNYEQGKKY